MLISSTTPHIQLAVVGRTSNRCLLKCSPITWMRIMIFISRYGFDPINSDISGITPDRVEAFTEALERALLFVPETDAVTQATAWRHMTDVPADTRLTPAQMALRECLLPTDREQYPLGWSSPQTRCSLERLRVFTLLEGGVRLERVP